jgi:hypothetical protein
MSVGSPNLRNSFAAPTGRLITAEYSIVTYDCNTNEQAGTYAPFSASVLDWGGIEEVERKDRSLHFTMTLRLARNPKRKGKGLQSLV